LLAFVNRYNRTARPLNWEFTAADLTALLAAPASASRYRPASKLIHARAMCRRRQRRRPLDHCGNDPAMGPPLGVRAAQGRIQVRRVQGCGVGKQAPSTVTAWPAAEMR
jgi:hypothetical protein